MKRYLLLILLLILPSFAWSATATIDGSTEYQTIYGFGGSEHGNLPAASIWPVMYDDVGVSLIRFEMEAYIESDPDIAGNKSRDNDNADPAVIDWDGVDLVFIDAYGPMLQDAQSRGVKIIGTTWSPPAWMKSSNLVENAGNFVVGEEAELVEYITIWVKGLEIYYGVHVDAVTIQNEPDNTQQAWSQCGYTSAQIRDIIKLLGARFELEGITTEIYGPDTTGLDSFSANYYSVICGDATAKGYTSALSTHPYWEDENNPDGDIPEWTDAYYNCAWDCGKPLWQTEFGGPGDADDFADSLVAMQHMHNGLIYGQVSVWTTFEIYRTPGGGLGLIHQDGTIQKRGYLFEQYWRYVRPEAVRVDTSSTDSDILVTAFNNEEAKTFTIVAINRKVSAESTTFNISGIDGPPASLSVYRTSSTEDVQALSPETISSGSFTHTLAAESVTTFTGSTSTTPVVTLTVDNDFGVTYPVGHPVTNGVPIAEADNITNIMNLKLTSDGTCSTQVDAQFKVNSRWGPLADTTKPIKWVLVDFQLSSQITDGNSGTYYLCRGMQIPSSTGIELDSSNAAYYEIDTGTGGITFQVPKSGENQHLFNNITLNSDSTVVVNNDTASGIEVERRTDGDLDTFSSYYDTANTVEIEEQGDMRVALKIHGIFKTSGGTSWKGGDARRPVNGATNPSGDKDIEYTVRIHAYKGKPYLNVSYTLENNGFGHTSDTTWPVNNAWIDGNYVKLKAGTLGGSSYTATYYGGSESIISGDDLNLYTYWTRNDTTVPYDDWSNMMYWVRKNDSSYIVNPTSDRADGWMDVSGSSHGVAIGMSNFWENYQKDVRWTNGYLMLGVFPSYDEDPTTIGYNDPAGEDDAPIFYAPWKGKAGGGLDEDVDGHLTQRDKSDWLHFNSYCGASPLPPCGRYFFGGSWHKTTRMQIVVHSGTAVGAGVEDTMTRLRNPLFAKAPTTHYADTKAWGRIAAEGTMSYSGSIPRVNDGLTNYQKFTRLPIDSSQNEYSSPTWDKDLDDIRRNRHPANAAATTSWNMNLYGYQTFGSFAQNQEYSINIYDWPFTMWLHYMRTGDEEYRRYGYEITDHYADLDLVHCDVTTGNTFGWDGRQLWEVGAGGNFRSAAPYDSIVDYQYMSTKASWGGNYSHTWSEGYVLGYLLTGDRRYLDSAGRVVDALRRNWGGDEQSYRDPLGCGGSDCDAVSRDPQNHFEWQTRMQGWSILILVNQYKATGNAEFLKDALRLWLWGLRYTYDHQYDADQNTNKWDATAPYNTTPANCPLHANYQNESWFYIMYGDDDIAPCLIKITFLTYYLEPLARLHYEIGIENSIDSGFMSDYLDDGATPANQVTVQNAYDDMVDGMESATTFLIDAAIKGQAFSGSDYSYSTIPYLLNPYTQANGGATWDIVHNPHIAGFLAYMSNISAEPDKSTYLTQARKLFRDVMLYRNRANRVEGDCSPTPRNTEVCYHDPDTYGNVGWRGDQVWMAGDWQKVYGYIMRGGQDYLYEETAGYIAQPIGLMMGPGLY